MATSTDRDGLDILQALADQAQDAAMENISELVTAAKGEPDQRTIQALANLAGTIMHLQNQQSTMIDLLYVLTQNTAPPKHGATVGPSVPAG